MLPLILLSFFLQIEKPFKRVELSYNNSVYSTNLPTWVDTVLQVGLDVAGLHSQTVFINPLPENHADDLKAFVTRRQEAYYIYIQRLDRRETIQVLSHEIIHIEQYSSGELSYDEESGMVNWLSESYYINGIDYELRPWERAAFSRQGEISDAIEDKLW